MFSQLSNDSQPMFSSDAYGEDSSSAGSSHRFLSWLSPTNNMGSVPKKEELENLGISKKLLFCALLWLLLGYFLVNSVLRVALWRNVSCGHPIHVTSSVSKMDMANQYLKLTESSDSIQSWVVGGITNAQTQTSSEFILNLVQSIRSNSKDRDKMKKKLERMLQGNPRWYIFLSVNQPTGNEILNELTKSSDGSNLFWNEKIKNDQYGKEKEVFLTKTLNLLIARQGGIIHSIHRVNGWIQIITVYLGILTICLILRRRKMIENLQKSCTLNPEFATLLPAQERSLECVYQPLNYIISILPGLGFIGTVLGMGASLLHADSLFSSADKQAAIGEMTRQLGFAFDTTLVALIVGIILGIALTCVQTRESKLRFGFQEQQIPTGEKNL